MVKNKKINYKINENIKHNNVRIIGEIEKNSKIVTINEALNIAHNLELDLVEINSNANPPVCKIVDYSKFLYDIKKKKRKQEKKQKENSQKIKEIRFGPNTEEHDYKFKRKHAENFLKNNNIVKSYVSFKGREIQFKDKGELLLLRLANDLSDISKIDTLKPKLEGKKMTLIIKPKKKINK